jgi:phenylpropionate dioxygenase-like ring-hydroxylating dioxygenase large terminal subunit
MSRERIYGVAETLLGYFEHGKTYQADRIMTVPARSYTDPTQWRSEIDLIFKRVPLMLALTCELPNPGDYKAMEVVGLPVLLVRDNAGTIRAFLNVCSHRWTPVVSEGYGHCTRFVCPLHGWSYGVDGRLIGIADSMKFGDIDKSVHGLTQLPCEERHGMVFVCLTPRASLDLDVYYGELLDEYAVAGLRDWTFVGSRFVEGVNWKITLSNFFESYHFAALHRKTVAPVLMPDIMHYEAFGPNIRIAFANRPIAKLRDIPRTTWGDQEGQGYFSFMRFFFPNTTGSFAFELSGDDAKFDATKGGICLFTQTFPGPTPDKSRMLLLFARRYPAKTEAERASLDKFIDWQTLDVVRDEDVASAIQIQRTLGSQAHEGLLYGRNERGNQYFQEWVDWYLKRDATEPKPTL